MAKLFKASTFGVFSKKKKIGSAQRQARKVGATVGKASEKARAASEREFADPTLTITDLLGGAGGSLLGSSGPRRPRRSR